jgi:hypothetical protein
MIGPAGLQGLRAILALQRGRAQQLWRGSQGVRSSGTQSDFEDRCRAIDGSVRCLRNQGQRQLRRWIGPYNPTVSPLPVSETPGAYALRKSLPPRAPPVPEPPAPARLGSSKLSSPLTSKILVPMSTDGSRSGE